MMIRIILCYLCLTFAFLSPTFGQVKKFKGGNEVGNGGVIVFFHDSTIASVDYVEFTIISALYNLTTTSRLENYAPQGANEYEIAKKMIESLEHWGLDRSSIINLKQRLRSLLAKTHFTDASLALPKDFTPDRTLVSGYYVDRFESCILQNTKTFQFVINKPLWTSLTKLQRATLLVHEAFMNYAIDANKKQNIPSSTIIRRLTGTAIAAFFHSYLTELGKIYWAGTFERLFEDLKNQNFEDPKY